MAEFSLSFCMFLFFYCGEGARLRQTMNNEVVAMHSELFIKHALNVLLGAVAVTAVHCCVYACVPFGTFHDYFHPE